MYDSKFKGFWTVFWQIVGISPLNIGRLFPLRNRDELHKKRPNINASRRPRRMQKLIQVSQSRWRSRGCDTSTGLDEHRYTNSLALLLLLRGKKKEESSSQLPRDPTTIHDFPVTCGPSFSVISLCFPPPPPFFQNFLHTFHDYC